jgi:hypothetical protein
MINKTLDITMKNEKDIEILLKERGYQTKKQIDSILKPCSSTDAPYDYLLTMGFKSLSKEKCNDLENKTKTKQKELEILMKKTPEDLWRQDLLDFISIYKETEKKELDEMYLVYQEV